MLAPPRSPPRREATPVLRVAAPIARRGNPLASRGRRRTRATRPWPAADQAGRPPPWTPQAEPPAPSALESSPRRAPRGAGRRARTGPQPTRQKIRQARRERGFASIIRGTSRPNLKVTPRPEIPKTSAHSRRVCGAAPIFCPRQCYSPTVFGWIPGGKSGRVIAIAVAAGLSTGFLLVPWQGSPDDPKEPLPEVTLLRQKLTARHERAESRARARAALRREQNQPRAARRQTT